MKRLAFLSSLYLIFVIFMISCAGPERAPAPIITEAEKQMAINVIEEHRGARDAAISQNNYELSLAIIVDYGVSKAEAKDLGENFVRSVKTFSKDEAPGQEIGSGVYDYLIGVYYPNKKQIVMGAKSSIARKITW